MQSLIFAFYLLLRHDALVTTTGYCVTDATAVCLLVFCHAIGQYVEGSRYRCYREKERDRKMDEEGTQNAVEGSGKKG